VSFSAYFTGVFACFSLSSAYHTFSSHSKDICEQWLVLDFIGIVCLIAGSWMPGVYYGFYCQRTVSRFYLAFGRTKVKGRTGRIQDLFCAQRVIHHESARDGINSTTSSTKNDHWLIVLRALRKRWWRADIKAKQAEALMPGPCCSRHGLQATFTVTCHRNCTVIPHVLIPCARSVSAMQGNWQVLFAT